MKPLALSDRCSEEFINAELGDPRRRRRLVRLVASLARCPDASFPAALRDPSALEAAYRFLNNPRVKSDDILAPHVAATATRAAAAASVLVLHDTSEFKFAGEERTGLGRLRAGKTQGFFGHFALAVEEGSAGMPLGVLGLETWTRSGPSRWKGSRRIAGTRADSESARWGRLVRVCASRLDETAAIHVMDREADNYDLLATLVDEGHRFVIRLAHDRVLESGEKIHHVLDAEPYIVERDVYLARRVGSGSPTQRSKFPQRPARQARLSLRRAAVSIRRSQQATGAATLSLHVIEVVEVAPPSGQEPIHWRLVTTEPIETAADVERVVDIYRQRWLIEEYFKSLKTGCAFEKRQLESYDALRAALAIFVPIAWSLLVLRDLPRVRPDERASVVLTRTQCDVLRSTSRTPLPRLMTIFDAMMAVAALGGHLPNNGAPGWQVLGRGFETLLTLERGWNAAKGTAEM